MPDARADRPGLFGLATVRGRSMAPTLRPGDVLLVRYVGPAARIRAGRLVVVRLPPGPDGVPRPTGVKRLVGPAPGPNETGWWVERDNPREGTDSWSFGALPDQALVAVVIARVAPWRRIGLPRRRSPRSAGQGRSGLDGRHQRDGG